MKTKICSPQGIKEAEIKAVSKLSKELPSDWFGYASFVANDRSGSMEIDLLIITQDRFILCEIKEWIGEIVSSGGFWYQKIGERSYKHVSPVNIKKEHKERLRSLFDNGLSQEWGYKYNVDYVIILANNNKSILPDNEKKVVFGIDEFIKIRKKEWYEKILPQHRNYYQFEKNLIIRPNDKKQISIFEKWFYGTRNIGKRKIIANGYVVPEENDAIFTHPLKLYYEFDANHSERKGLKSLIRKWNFTVLGEYAYTQEQKAEIALREKKVNEYISIENNEIKKDYLMNPLHSSLSDEVDNDFIEVYEHPQNIIRLDNYLLELNNKDKKVDCIKKILVAFSKLHTIKVAHRDISLQKIWYDNATSSIILSGFTAAKFPDNSSSKSVSDLREKILSNNIPIPEYIYDEYVNPFYIDVYQLGAVIYNIAFGRECKKNEDSIEWVEPDGDEFDESFKNIIKKAISFDVKDRYKDATYILEAISDLNIGNKRFFDIETIRRDLGDYYNPEIVPYIKWPPTNMQSIETKNGRQSYKSANESTTLLVKIWPSLRYEINEDIILRKIYSFLKKCSETRNSDLNIEKPIYFGLCPIGLYVVNELIEGISLDEYLKNEIDTELKLNICKQIVTSVIRMHEKKIYHGDLKPGNIMISNNIIKIIDINDIDQFGNRIYNEEYSSDTVESIFGVDRYATYLIIDEIIRGSILEIKNEIINAIGHDCSKEPMSLAPLLDSIENSLLNLHKDINDVTNIIIYSIGNRNLKKIEPLQDGFKISIREHKDLNTKKWKIIIVGLREKITLIASYENMFIEKVWIETINPSYFAFIFKHRRYFRNYNIAISSSNKNEDNDSISKFLMDILDNFDNNYGDIQAKSQIINIWKTLIELEYQSTETIHVDSAPKFVKNNIYHFQSNGYKHYEDKYTVNTEVTNSDINNKIYYGELDSNTSDDNIYIKKNRKARIPKVGDILYIRDKLTAESIFRRKNAIDRICSGQSIIKNLIDYFDRKQDSISEELCVDISDLQLSSYKKRLDKSQIEAFYYALGGRFRVIVGPPGTGKTTLLSVLLDYLCRSKTIKRILLVSQSHVAVNEIASRTTCVINEINSEINEICNFDMVRLGDKDKIPDDLLNIYTESIQKRYRLDFISDAENRILSLSSRVKLPIEFIKKASFVFINLSFLIHDYTNLKEKLKTELHSSDSKLINRCNSIEENIRNRLLEYTDDPDAIIFTDDIQLNLLKRIGSAYNVNNPKEVKKLSNIIDICYRWVNLLQADIDGFSSFLAKTRKLVIGTCVGIGKSSYDISKHEYDVVIVDEAGRASAGELAIAMQSAKRVILVGDYNQLQPFYNIDVVSNAPSSLSMSSDIIFDSDFHRACINNNSYTLKVQYRMQEPISNLVSHVFYNDILLTGCKKEQTILDYSPWNSYVTWVDTSSFDNTEKSINKSFYNDLEIDIICSQLKLLLSEDKSLAKIESWSEDGRTSPIGIITGYSGQVKRIVDKIDSEPLLSNNRDFIKIDTIDSYQGGENRIVIISLVRSNVKESVGFMDNDSRLNVAISRAKNHLLIIGSSKMWSTKISSPTRKIFNFIKNGQATNNLYYKIIDAETIMG